MKRRFLRLLLICIRFRLLMVIIGSTLLLLTVNATAGLLRTASICLGVLLLLVVALSSEIHRGRQLRRGRD
jgi:hypothetical protein